MIYVAEIQYSCGHTRTALLKSKELAGKRYRDIKCYRCRAKELAKEAPSYSGLE